MGFPVCASHPTTNSFLRGYNCDWSDWRSSAIAVFLAAARARLLELLDGLPSDGKGFRELEERMHREVARCLDHVTATVLRVAHFSKDVRGLVGLLLEADPHLRTQKAREEHEVTFLGGSSHRVATPYMLRRPPRGPGRPRGRGKRGLPGNGLYPFLVALGVQDRVTPALASEVALQVTCSTEEQARSNLARRGIELSKKSLSTIVKNFGVRALQYRDERVLAGVASELGDVSGARIVVGTDGGRLRTRVPKKRGRKKANGRRGFEAPWREPKVITIYEIDSEGRKKRKGGFCYHDATMGDADQAFELLSGVLRSIKADRASEWIIVGDGARWIWSRIDELVETVGYSKDKVTEVVDLYHARQKLHEFGNAIKSFSKRQRTRWINRMKALLDQGELEKMHDEFSMYFKGCNSKVRRSLAAYFQKNTERMRYARFRASAIPMGSGAVESSVRRLVNLRMKGNGIFWKIETAERLLFLRGQMLAGRWDRFVDHILRPRELW